MATPLLQKTSPQALITLMLVAAHEKGAPDPYLQVMDAIDKVELDARAKGDVAFDRLRYYAELRRELGKQCPRG